MGDLHQTACITALVGEKELPYSIMYSEWLLYSISYSNKLLYSSKYSQWLLHSSICKTDQFCHKGRSRHNDSSAS